MKNILIFSHGLEIGGAEKALLGLLEAIDTSKYNVDLFLMRHEGALFKYIPDKINLLEELPEYASLAVPIGNVLKKHQFKVAIGRLIGKQLAKKRVRELQLPKDNDVALEYSHKYTLNAMPQISSKRYDLAISFLTPHYFVANKVRAKKKIAWIHTDYSVVSVDKESQLEMWKQYDKIVSISVAVTKSFLKCFPELEKKIIEIENILPKDLILKQVDEKNIDNEMPNDGSIKVLSIGRYCVAKNFDNIPEICKKIIENGINIKWYIIGFGSDEELIKKKIIEYGMQKNVILLGKKENPYPYIKQCDFYIQPSRYEGKCVSVKEAQMLEKPVIITNYATATSQLEDNIDGIIVPLDNKLCSESIINIIRDHSKKEILISNCKKRDYTNMMEVEKIYNIII